MLSEHLQDTEDTWGHLTVVPASKLCNATGRGSWGARTPKWTQPQGECGRSDRESRWDSLAGGPFQIPNEGKYGG